MFKSPVFYIKKLLKKGFDIMSEILNGVEVKATSIIYAQLILEGKYTFNKVVKYFKSDTALVLVVLGAEDLITDSAYLQEAKKRIAEANQVQQ